MKLPKSYTKFLDTYPEIGHAYKELGKAVAAAGPLDEKTRALIKLGIAIGAKQEGGARSQTRKAREAGATIEEIRHAVLQATTTIGFANMMAGLSWVNDVFKDEKDH